MYPGSTDRRIFVGTNEIIAQQVLNRVFKGLISSDLENLELYNGEISKLRIHEYGDTEGGYAAGDVVWIPGDGSRPPYLLRSTRDGNVQDPLQAIYIPTADGTPDFSVFGWKDLNYSPSISSSGVYSTISGCVDDVFTAHETDSELHKYEKISPISGSTDYIFGKIAKSDFSNVDPDRSTVFFPFQTGHFTTDSVMNGIYRIWDSGYLEMDIVFRLGKDGIGDTQQVISANNVTFQQSPTLNSRSRVYNANSDYFMDESALGIFDVAGYQNSVKIGNIPQRNRNDFVNTYFADIDFTKADIRDLNGNRVLGFADLNYMIFKADTMCQTRNLKSGTINPAQNSMTFTNRTRNGFTAVYVTYPEAGQQDFRGSGTRNGGLVANSFSCRVAGRWK